jgi:hypothetical protein
VPQKPDIKKKSFCLFLGDNTAGFLYPTVCLTYQGNYVFFLYSNTASVANKTLKSKSLSQTKKAAGQANPFED